MCVSVKGPAPENFGGIFDNSSGCACARAHAAHSLRRSAGQTGWTSLMRTLLKRPILGQQECHVEAKEERDFVRDAAAFFARESK